MSVLDHLEDSLTICCLQGKVKKNGKSKFGLLTSEPDRGLHDVNFDQSQLPTLSQIERARPLGRFLDYLLLLLTLIAITVFRPVLPASCLFAHGMSGSRRVAFVHTASLASARRVAFVHTASSGLRPASEGSRPASCVIAQASSGLRPASCVIAHSLLWPPPGKLHYRTGLLQSLLDQAPGPGLGPVSDDCVQHSARPPQSARPGRRHATVNTVDSHESPWLRLQSTIFKQ